MSKLPDLGSVPRDLDKRLRDLLEGMREHIRALRGFDGRGENIALSEGDIRDIVANEVATLPAGGGGSSGSTTYVPDYTEPPTPTGVVVTAGMSYITIETAVPTFTAGHGYDRTVIYGAQWPAGDTAPTFSAAVPVDEFVGNIGSFPTKMATRWCIWVKWRTKDGVLSTTAAGGANGYQVTTGQDVALLLDVLTNQISASQLAGALSTKINLIDAPAAAAGSVDARIKTETDARITADDATLSAAQNYTASYAYSKSQTDAQISTYAYAKAEVDSAIASSISTVSARLNAGGDIATAISTEATARAEADGHLGALYTVRVQLTEGGRTVMGGFGISGASSVEAGATIDFGVQANKFWIGAPAGSTGVSDVQPFVVQTTDETVNGVLVPKGVYMDAAYIRNLSVLWGRFGSLVADSIATASLNASQLTLGDGTVGGNLKSSGYTPGGTGWLLNSAGSFYAYNGTIGGITISGAALYSGQSSFDSGTGFWLGGDGKFSVGSGPNNKLSFDGANFTLKVPGLTIENGNATFNGTMGALTVFAGQLNAAYGTLGTITSGLLRSSTVPQTFINLGATGSQTFMNVFDPVNFRSTFKITADGDVESYKLLASGNVNYGSGAVGVQVLRRHPTNVAMNRSDLVVWDASTYFGSFMGSISYVWAIGNSVYVNTGIEVPYSAVFSKSLTARAKLNTTHFVFAGGGVGSGQQLGKFDVSCAVVLHQYQYVDVYPPGAETQHVYIRIDIRPFWSAKGVDTTQIWVNSLEWALDFVP